MAKISNSRGNKHRTLVVWHTDQTPPTHNNASVYCWNGYAECQEYRSIAAYLEANAERLRAKYLALIYELGETEINGKRIVEHLEVGKGYNLWWMSSLAEKNYINTPRIVDCLKVFALEEILNISKPDNVLVYTDDKELLESIKALCAELGISCSLTRVNGAARTQIGWRRWIPFRPKPLSAVWWLLQHVRSYWGLRKKVKPDWFAGPGSIIFFSYFIHLIGERCARGEFSSAHWGKLLEYLTRKGLKINWIHHFMLSAVVKDVRTGISWKEAFNKNSQLQGNHAFFDEYLSPSIILKVCLKFISILVKSFTLINASKTFQPKGSVANLWHLLKNEWFASIRGATAMRNLLFIELIDAALKDLPRQKLGFYLQENLFWERALINAWRRYGHGKLVGVPSATVRFWDLRYFDDLRTISDQSMASQPLPDAVALNGSVARKTYLDAGYPVEDIVEVEALRYLYLAGYQEAMLASKKNEARPAENSSSEIKAIILGDISFDVTEGMLRCIEGVGSQNKKMSFTLKVHPGQPMNVNNYNIPKLSETTLQLADSLFQFSLAIVAGSTSAALDAYLADLPVIVFLSGGGLNLSPLRGVAGVTFVSTQPEMSLALAAYDSTKPRSQKQDFFWLDQGLPRWRKLLAESDYH